MSKEKGASILTDLTGKNLPAPPGFEALTAFSLKRIREIDDIGSSKGCLDATKEVLPTGMSDNCVLETHYRKRLRIVSDPTNYELEESDGEQPGDQTFFAGTCIPKGVIHGCPDCSNSLKVTARWRPEDAKRDAIEEAPVFYPTEEEFKDTLEYIAKIRPRAESHGICRVIPPSSWNPPCVLQEEKIWVKSRFVTRVQRIDGLQVPYSKCKTSSVEDSNGERRRTLGGIGLGFGSDNGQMERPGETGFCNTERVEPVNGPEFTLESFEKYAEDFRGQYFCKSNTTTSNDCSSGEFQPSIENIEGEYKRIVDSPTEEIEVLYCDGLMTRIFGSGFPTVSNSNDLVNSGWNLNNLPTIFGSLFSLESCETSLVLAPQVRIGMCFSTLNWRVEEHHLYSLCYMHLGAPKIWYAIPSKYSSKFRLALKSVSADILEKQHRPVKTLLPSALKSEGIPVFRCVQNPGEFIVVFPGAYRSGFDCGFNCTETANFAPLDWLPHGQNAVQLYRDLGRKTSLSHDKLLLQAASEAVRAQFELSLLRNNTSNNRFWKDATGKEAILTNAVKSRVNSEEKARKFLCNSSQTRVMDKNFDGTIKRECKICLYDLHLSAAGCPCSTDVYSCLDHAKQLCFSCAWSDKFFLFRHDMNDLNLLVEALEGKLSSAFKWAKVKLGLTLNSTASAQASPPENRPSNRSELKAILLQAALSNKLIAKDPATPFDGATNLASSVNKATEACTSEPAKDLTCVNKTTETCTPEPVRNLSACVNKSTEACTSEPARNLAACVNKTTETCTSEPTKISDPLEPKQKTATPAFGFSTDTDNSFPQMTVALGICSKSICDTSSDDESDNDEPEEDSGFSFMAFNS